MPEINSQLPVEPIYPDYTLPPGAETKTYDNVPEDEENGETNGFETDGDPVKDPAAAEKEAAAAKKKAEEEYLDDPLGLQDFALMSEKEYEKRQKIFNPKLHRYAVKTDKGKPANHTDPYPIDTKIVELETHQPRMAYKKVGATEIISSIVQLSQNAERRVSQLENITATMLRYLFRLSSRVNVNCVYYGGQDTFQKYNCIRCLHTDRINDGQSMSLDQCLNCSRYEPIIGQIYDILDGEGQNLAAILDNNQMAYMNMDDHIKLSRLEEMHTEPLMADLKKKGEVPNTLSEKWGDGNKMNWGDTPIGGQIPRVASYKYGNGPMYDAASLVAAGMQEATMMGGGEYSEIFDAANSLNPEFHGAVTSSNSKIQSWINDAQGYAKGAVVRCVDNMIKHGYKDILVSKSVEVGVDPYLTLALITTESTGNPDANKFNLHKYKGLMQVPNRDNVFDPAVNIAAGLQIYLSKVKAVGTKNPLFALIAYNSGEGALLGYSKWGAPRILPSNPNSEVRWVDFVPTLEKQIANHFASHGWSTDEKCEYFLRVMYCYNYLIQEIKKRGVQFYQPPSTQIVEGGTTIYDGALKMPFAPADLSGIMFLSDYGMRFHPNDKVWKMHNGIDLSPTKVRLAKGDVHILAAGAGIVSSIKLSSTGGGNTVIVQHDNGYSTAYCHCKDKSIVVKQGDKVVAGQRLASVGSTGNSTGPHLHFGVKITKDGEYVDPKTVLRNLSGKLNKSL